ncbi:MAG: ribosomal protein L16 Arg81 hydroxylase [Parasphingorhabdus sp.]
MVNQKSSPMNIFSSLFPQVSAADFLIKYWPNKALWADGDISRLPEPLRCEALSSIEALAATYRGRITFGNAKTGSRTVAVDHISAEMLHTMGLSLYLPELEKCLPKLREMLAAMEVGVGAPPGSARIGAFVAPPENGVTSHFDAEEVFSIQLIGEKRFFIAKMDEIEQPMGLQFNPGDVTFDDLYPQARDGFPDVDKVEHTVVDLKPGSVLFMPRGTWHRTETSSDSLSISIILRPPAAMESVLELLRNRMLQDAKWRTPLHGAWGNAQQQQTADQQLAGLLKDLPNLLTDVNLGDVLPTQLTEAERLALLNPASYFQAKPEATLTIKQSGGKNKAHVVARDMQGRELEMLQLDVPMAMLPVFRWLQKQTAAFSAADVAAAFSQLAMDQHLRILDAMVRGGFLKQLWYRPKN